MKNIIEPIVILAILGGAFGVMLAIASNIFRVDLDPKVSAILASLPGANCGACGFPGCEGLANAIANGKAPVTGCTIGGQSVANKVAEIMGVSAGAMERDVAKVMCNGTCEKAVNKYVYNGIRDCRAMNDLSGGSKACVYGCLGGGTCKDVCEFDAIVMKDGIAVIDKEKCVACKRCISVCPKNLIKMVPYEQQVIVKCNSKDKGKDVKSACAVGCIGCKMCVKACAFDAIIFEDNLARIDNAKCTQCGACAVKCPTKAIESHVQYVPPVEAEKQPSTPVKETQEISN